MYRLDGLIKLGQHVAIKMPKMFMVIVNNWVLFMNVEL